MNLPLHTIDITGHRFGLWTALRYGHSKPQGAIWVCRCDCGTQREILSSVLRRGASTSCGCITGDLISQAMKVNFICKIEDCGRTADAKQFCDKHYRRFKKYGSPDERSRYSAIPIRSRLNDASVVKPSGCREWMRGVDKDGYGQIKRNGVGIRAHRAAWEISNGPIPRGLFVCHSCDNPRCIELSHLWLGTALDNRRDCLMKGRGRSRSGPINWKAA